MIVKYKNLVKEKKQQHKTYVFDDDGLNENITRILGNS